MVSCTLILSLIAGTLASPVDLAERQSCPAIHVFGARETTAAPGYGSAGTVVNAILNAHPGATAEVSVLTSKTSIPMRYQANMPTHLCQGHQLSSLWEQPILLGLCQSRQCSCSKPSERICKALSELETGRRRLFPGSRNLRQHSLRRW